MTLSSKYQQGIASLKKIVFFFDRTMVSGEDLFGANMLYNQGNGEVNLKM